MRQMNIRVGPNPTIELVTARRRRDTSDEHTEERPSESRTGVFNASSQKNRPQEKPNLAQHLDLWTSFQAQKTNFCSLEPPSLWNFVTKRS